MANGVSPYQLAGLDEQLMKSLFITKQKKKEGQLQTKIQKGEMTEGFGKDLRDKISKINDAIKTYLNITSVSRYRHDKIPTLNKSHQLNLDRLDMILHEKKFYNKWKEQFEEDINLNEIISQNIKKFNKTEWNEKVLFKYGLHLDYYFKKISSDF